ncbi:hypothetical protein BASA81_008280 [Batrachochytrium salamandrivorans]|nr:hypothetical protein BASA81_008280 [Batrachochytrium salamandrivorans]
MMNLEPPDKHRSIKQSLKSVVRDPASQRTILGVVHASREHHERALRGERAPGNERRQACHAAPQAGTPRVPSCSIWSGNVLHPRRATSTSSPTPCRQTGSRARCCGTRRAPEKKKRLARKRELLALPKDLKRVRPEPSAKRAELYVAPTGSSERVVGVDPGKSDLISSGTGPGDWFRYTQKRDETGEKKHRRARTKMARTLVEGKTVVEWELSTFSRKALTVSAAEAWGDWSRGSQMKFLEPTKGVGMRKLFSRAGYEVVLVDEFRTSCTCFGCEGGACEKFRSVTNPRSWMRETYGPAKRAAQLPKLQAVVEQGPQRVAQHHASSLFLSLWACVVESIVIARNCDRSHIVPQNCDREPQVLEIPIEVFVPTSSTTCELYGFVCKIWFYLPEGKDYCFIEAAKYGPGIAEFHPSKKDYFPVQPSDYDLIIPASLTCSEWNFQPDELVSLVVTRYGNQEPYQSEGYIERYYPSHEPFVRNGKTYGNVFLVRSSFYPTDTSAMFAQKGDSGGPVTIKLIRGPLVVGTIIAGSFPDENEAYTLVSSHWSEAHSFQDVEE